MSHFRYPQILEVITLSLQAVLRIVIAERGVDLIVGFYLHTSQNVASCQTVRVFRLRTLGADVVVTGLVRNGPVLGYRHHRLRTSQNP